MRLLQKDSLRAIDKLGNNNSDDILPLQSALLSPLMPWNKTKANHHIS